MKVKLDNVILIMQLVYVIIKVCLIMVKLKLARIFGVAIIDIGLFGNLVEYAVLSVGYYWLKTSQQASGAMLVLKGDRGKEIQLNA